MFLKKLILDNLTEKLYDILLFIDTTIYGFIAKLFNLFVDLANATIFSEEIIRSFTNRVYVIVGIIALFVVSYNLLTMIVDPDKLQKTGSNFVMKVVSSLIIVLLVPTIFSFAQTVQNTIINDGIIGKLLLGKNEVTLTVEGVDQNGNVVTDGFTYELSSPYFMKEQGSHLAWSVFNAFIYPNTEHPDIGPGQKYETGDYLITEYSNFGTYKTFANINKFVVCGKSALIIAGHIVTKVIPSQFDDAVITAVTPSIAWNLIKCYGAIAIEFGANTAYELTDEKVSWGTTRVFAAGGNFDFITAWSPHIVQGYISYTPVLSTICGLILLYMIFSFCLDLGVRAVKLAFYQMIAPIPIFLRILPNNDKTFNNWIKVTIATYMEIFIRLIVIYIIVYFASNISELQIAGVNGLAKAIVILGLVTFARQLPKILADITGIDSGNMKIGIMEKLGAGGALAVGALVGGAVMGGLKNGVNNWKNSRGQHWTKRVKSTAGGVFKGAASGGFRSAKNTGFKAKSAGEVWEATKKGSTEAHEKYKKKQKARADHPGFMGPTRAKVKDAWNDLIYDDELKEYNDRIKTAQDFDIKKKVEDWVISNDTATKEADAEWKSFTSRKLTDAEILDNERKRLEALINDRRVSKADRKKYKEELSKINTGDAIAIENVRNLYLRQYWSESERLRKRRNEVRDEAIKRYANTTGSEVQSMIIEANKIRNNNRSDTLFRNTTNISYENVVKDLSSNHDNMFGADKIERDDYGRVLRTEHKTVGTVEELRGSQEYRRAFERYKEKVEKGGK